MRTNEELALMIQEGNRGAAAELWEQNKGIIYRLVSRYFPLCNAVVSQEDLLQSAYFAIDRAVKAYDPSRDYVFASYLSFHIRNAARDAFGQRGKKEPRPFIVSLDAPVNGIEDGSITIGDSIEDETATAAMEGIQEDWQREQLRACLDDCICELAPEQAAVIRAHYYNGKTLRTIAEETNSNPGNVRLLEDKAMRALRAPKNKPRLSSFLYDDDCDCKGYGLGAYRNRGFVSMVEVKAGAY